ncbi:MAG: hypothetical protein PSX81_02620 [bacterium]|nr:hypothetical protein [bacterium]
MPNYQKNSYLQSKKRLDAAFKAIICETLDWSDDVEFNKRTDKTLITNAESIVLGRITFIILQGFPDANSII